MLRVRRRAAATFELMLLVGVSSVNAASRRPPHVAFVLVDDLGHANVGFNRKDDGSATAAQALAETNTPRIDSLAGDGIVLRHHYTYSFCSPSRSSLVTGRLGVHVNMHNVLKQWARTHFIPAQCLIQR